MKRINKIFEKCIDNKIIRIRLDELNFHPELEKAFKINEDVKKRIEDDINENGNNTKAHPIHIFRMNGKWYVSDGHTRVTVLRELGFTHVWAQVHVFASISEALCNTMAEQFNRRNESDADLLSRYLLLREQTKNGKKLTADELASKLNKSRRHIFKLQEVFSKSSKQQIEDIKNGTASINSVYQEIKKQEAEEAGEVVVEELLAEEQPSASTPTIPKASKPTKTPYQDGYSAGIRYALQELSAGKTAEQLLSELAE